MYFKSTHSVQAQTDFHPDLNAMTNLDSFVTAGFVVAVQSSVARRFFSGTPFGAEKEQNSEGKNISQPVTLNTRISKSLISNPL